MDRSTRWDAEPKPLACNWRDIMYRLVPCTWFWCDKWRRQGWIIQTDLISSNSLPMWYGENRALQSGKPYRCLFPLLGRTKGCQNSYLKLRFKRKFLLTYNIGLAPPPRDLPRNIDTAETHLCQKWGHQEKLQKICAKILHNLTKRKGKQTGCEWHLSGKKKLLWTTWESCNVIVKPRCAPRALARRHTTRCGKTEDEGKIGTPKRIQSSSHRRILRPEDCSSRGVAGARRGGPVARETTSRAVARFQTPVSVERQLGDFVKGCRPGRQEGKTGLWGSEAPRALRQRGRI